MSIFRKDKDEEHLTEDSVETVEERDAESYAGHMPDTENDQVDDMLEETGLYPNADDPDKEMPELDIAGEVRKTELARRGRLPATEIGGEVGEEESLPSNDK